MLINVPCVFNYLDNNCNFFVDQCVLQIEVGLLTTEQPMYTQESLHYIMNKINLPDLILICQIYLKILEAINQKGNGEWVLVEQRGLLAQGSHITSLVIEY